MADPHDVHGTKMARSYLGRRGVDLSLADVRVMHGVCYLRGTVSAVKGSGVLDIKTEVEQCARIMKQRPEIRDVVLDCIYRGGG
jgi:hypothetical protein